VEKQNANEKPHQAEQYQNSIRNNPDEHKQSPKNKLKQKHNLKKLQSHHSPKRGEGESHTRKQNTTASDPTHGYQVATPLEAAQAIIPGSWE